MLKTLRRWWRKFSGEGNRKGCLACGLCCELFGGYLHASSADLKRWRGLGRDDLLALVHPLGSIWVAADGRRGAPCPFLRRLESKEARCAIHAIKPDMCREYPGMDHGRHCVRGIFIPKTAFADHGASPPH